MIPTVNGFSVVTEAEVDVFLELSCSSYDPKDVGNLISGFSAFSKSSLNIWKFRVYVLLKPGLENFDHYFDEEGGLNLVLCSHSLNFLAYMCIFLFKKKNIMFFVHYR